MRNNPQSYEILFELGRLYNESYHETDRARNVWELAVRYWLKLTPEEQEENKLLFEQITTNLGQLEEKAGNYSQALNWYQAAQKVSLTPGELQKLIDGVKKKMAYQSQLVVPKSID